MQELKPLMTNGTLNENVVEALKLVLSMQALIDTLKPYVAQIYADALERFQPVVEDRGERITARRGNEPGKRITSKDRLLLASKDQIQQVLSFYLRKMREVGFAVNGNLCPLEEAKLDLMKAENALLAKVSPLTQIAPDTIHGQQRTKLVSLVMETLVRAATQLDVDLTPNVLKGPQMCLGEKIETVLHARESGVHGEYLGPQDDFFGVVKIDERTYGVRRDVEVTAPWFWQVVDMETGHTAQTDDQHGLGCIRAEQFTDKGEQA